MPTAPDPSDNADPSGNQIDDVLGGITVGMTLDALPQLGFAAALGSAPKVETLYVRSFAPWEWFGAEPPICFHDCFTGNYRTFTTVHDGSATSKVWAKIRFLLPGMSPVGAPEVKSDPSHDVYGRTGSGQPTISLRAPGNGTLHVELAGANPLYPGSPDVDTKLDISVRVDSGLGCYSGRLYGDAFPDSEVFVVNAQEHATMLHTFKTEGGRNSGPIHLLPGNNNRDMGSFSSKCALE
jgi:hypothetical protein